MLEDNMFVKVSDLQSRVMIAAKDANRRISWVTLDPVYHSILVQMAITASVNQLGGLSKSDLLECPKWFSNNFNLIYVLN